ncbi:hypothetical protein SAI_2366, partial [Streptococcus agalactiae H36B]
PYLDGENVSRYKLDLGMVEYWSSMGGKILAGHPRRNKEIFEKPRNFSSSEFQVNQLMLLKLFILIVMLLTT